MKGMESLDIIKVIYSTVGSWGGNLLNRYVLLGRSVIYEERLE